MSTKLLIFKEKDGERYFSYNTHEEFLMLCEFVVRERNSQQFYYENLTVKDAKLLSAALLGDRKAAWALLVSRDHYEYERYDLVETEQVEGVNS